MDFTWVVFGTFAVIIIYMGYYEDAWGNWNEDEPFPAF